jgi:hypothetical protein
LKVAGWEEQTDSSSIAIEKEISTTETVRPTPKKQSSGNKRQ